MRRVEKLGLIGVLCLAPWSTAMGQQYGPPDVERVAGGSAPVSAHDCTATGGNTVANCSFESGDFTDWVTSDIAQPFFPLTVDGPTYIGYGFFTSAPTQGSESALTGFDGDGPGTIEVAQDVAVPAGGVLEFDYRGAWDLQSFGAMQDRTFEVNVEPSGGGAPMQTDLILTAETGTLVTDTGPQSATVDLSAFSGQSVRVNFVWTVSESFSGPGFFEIDNVQLAPTIADLAVTKAATVQDDGTTVVFDLEVMNAGPGDATNVLVTDPLPACAELQSDDCGGDAGPPWTWSVGDLANGASAACSLTADASGCLDEGSQTNTATVEGNVEDPEPDNNSADAEFEIAEEMADLAITKAAMVQDDGTTVVFALEVTNAGPNDATGVLVTDTLPECTELQSDDCDGDAGPPWTWSIGSLANGASASCNVTVDASACVGEGAQTNIATVEGEQTDPTPDDSTAEAEFELEVVPALPLVAAVLLAVLLSIVALRSLRRARA